MGGKKVFGERSRGDEAQTGTKRIRKKQREKCVYPPKQVLKTRAVQHPGISPWAVGCENKSR